MKILLIVPLPPPVTGHSLASQTLVDALRGVHETAVVNLSIGSSNDGRISVRRIREVGKVLLSVWRRKRWADAIYLTISESRAGNLKDLLIYLLCVGRLSRLFVHLHGGTIGRDLFDRHPAWRRANAAFIKRLGGVIISGPSHLDIFAGMIDRRRIHLVPNSAQDQLFVSEQAILDKFADTRPLRVLYISSMTPEKGYLDLVEAWLSFGHEMRSRIQLDLAGRFDADADRSKFERRIAGIEGVRYHGLVDPEHKRCLFAQAHVFCLPTRMFEGQPISILEAYAAGCVVLTTGQRGIRDVFTDGVNGFEVLEGSAASLAAALTRAVDDIDRLRQMAVANRRTAGERYRADRFTGALTRILEAGQPEAGRS
jgi:glycosyltransferase involved in cell wall biosynthesis